MRATTTMDIKELKENESLELKAAENGLPSSFWETYSSFANTAGGSVYLGIRETNHGNILVKVANPTQIINSILSTSRNKTKVSLALIDESNIEKIVIDGYEIIKIDIPEAPRNEKPVYLNSNIADTYIRVGDGDHKADINEIRSMIMDNSTENYDYLPNKMNLGFESVNKETLSSFRKLYEMVHPHNYYSSLNDEEFLNAIGALTKNKDGISVLTNGSLLMFGNYFKITSVFENYMLDYREADSFQAKWAYRICSDDMNWSGNMFDFYSLVYQRIKPFLPNPFMTDGGQNIGAVSAEEALRESLVNALANYAVTLAGGLTVLLSGDKLTIRNPGRLKVGLAQALKGGKTNPRNAQILTFFRLLEISDKAGTGIPKIFSITKALSLPTPLLIEKAYPEETSLTLYFRQLKTDREDSQKILAFIASKGELGSSSKEMEMYFGVSRTYINKKLNELVKNGFIKTNGLKTNGRKYYVK